MKGAATLINKYRRAILFVIVLIGACLRLFNLAHGTPALSQDELVNGYDAYSLAHTMRDHHGAFMPLIFASFGDSVSVALTYMTVPFVLLGGLTEFAVRLPIALTGIASIALIYMLVREVTRNTVLALLASFVLATSPWHITITRWAVPPSLVPFCLLLFLWLLAVAYNRQRSKAYLLIAAGLAAGLLTYSYPSAEILAPLLVASAGLIFFWKKWRQITALFVSYGLSVLPLFYMVFLKPDSNFARFNSVKINATGVEFIRQVLSRYKDYFSYDFYFGTDSRNPIMHVPGIGNFYSILSVFMVFSLMILGFKFYRIKNKSRWLALAKDSIYSKICAFCIFWALIGPVPASISIDYSHVTRAIFMLPLVTLLLSGAIYVAVSEVKNIAYRQAVWAITLLLCLMQVTGYFHHYNTKYPGEAAASYQYGVKQGIQYLTAHQDGYKSVIVDRNINQPYIYYLFYKPYAPDQLNYDEINASRSQHLSFAVTKIGSYYFNPLTDSDIKGAKLLKSVRGYDKTWYDIYGRKNQELILKLH